MTDVGRCRWAAASRRSPVRSSGRIRNLLPPGPPGKYQDNTAWRDLSERFGPWQTVFNRFRRRAKARTGSGSLPTPGPGGRGQRIGLPVSVDFTPCAPTNTPPAPVRRGCSMPTGRRRSRAVPLRRRTRPAHGAYGAELDDIPRRPASYRENGARAAVLPVAGVISPTAPLGLAHRTSAPCSTRQPRHRPGPCGHVHRPGRVGYPASRKCPALTVWASTEAAEWERGPLRAP